ncbi:hypothetical protein PANT111_40246 [Pantoea brenneri]|uniref:Uncharacterized protein n=1 Tax=Pantoea brenneri TaxID=472694 RepID=A0AAX3JAN1_9GAMM|nr:hypothetical protein PANT111_40246 [Pantoea brenneri]
MRRNILKFPLLTRTVCADRHQVTARRQHFQRVPDVLQIIAVAKRRIHDNPVINGLRGAAQKVRAGHGHFRKRRAEMFSQRRVHFYALAYYLRHGRKHRADNGAGPGARLQHPTTRPDVGQGDKLPAHQIGRNKQLCICMHPGSGLQAAEFLLHLRDSRAEFGTHFSFSRAGNAGTLYIHLYIHKTPGEPGSLICQRGTSTVFMSVIYTGDRV